jgi:hypothetical protein
VRRRAVRVDRYSGVSPGGVAVTSISVAEAAAGVTVVRQRFW